MIVRLLLVAAALLTFAATALPVVAARFGAAVSPATLVVEDWRKPAFSLENPGTIAITVDLEIAGDTGYEVETSHLELQPNETASIGVTRLGDGEAIVRFHVTTESEGIDRQAIVLEASVRHRSFAESLPRFALIGAAVGAMLLVAIAWIPRRRRRHRT